MEDGRPQLAYSPVYQCSVLARACLMAQREERARTEPRGARRGKQIGLLRLPCTRALTEELAEPH